MPSFCLPPMVIADDLTVAIGGAVVRLTPAEGLALGEQLIRRSVRRAVVEELVRGAPVAGRQKVAGRGRLKAKSA